MGGLTLKLTRKQTTRLEQLANSGKDVRVTDWHPELSGPVVLFADTGATYVITRDGGLQKQ
jgi:hypothetical protein